MLAFEKEVVGVYISGHPLEEYQEFWKKQITATTADFVLNEETGRTALEDGQKVTIGGMIAEKKIKYTKNDKIMAFVLLEDLVGTVEVVIFPKDYERNSTRLTEDGKIFITGRVSLEEDRNGKLVCESVRFFEDVPRKVWIQFPDVESFGGVEGKLKEAISSSEGNDEIMIYVKEPKAIKQLPRAFNIHADEAMMERLRVLFGEENVRIVW